VPELVRSFFLTSSLVLMFVGQQSIHGFISLLCFIFLFTFYTPMGRSVLVCDFFFIHSLYSCGLGVVFCDFLKTE